MGEESLVDLSRKYDDTSGLRRCMRQPGGPPDGGGRVRTEGRLGIPWC